MIHLILLRHGESEINVRNRSGRLFCGQTDTPLTDLGRRQAVEAGRLLAARGDLTIRYAISSALQRARETMALVLVNCRRHRPAARRGRPQRARAGAVRGPEPGRCLRRVPRICDRRASEAVRPPLRAEGSGRREPGRGDRPGMAGDRRALRPRGRRAGGRSLDHAALRTRSCVAVVASRGDGPAAAERGAGHPAPPRRRPLRGG